MSPSIPSRTSLDDVISLILLSDFTDRQRQDMRSAVRTVARLIGAEPALIPAEPVSLRRRLEVIAPEAHGLSRGSWNNIRSLFRKALALVRPMMAGRSAQPILPEWEILAAKLPLNRRFRLIAMFRFLSARGKKPAEVTLADLENYREGIFNDRLRNRPEKTWDALTWAWNASERDIEGWPAIAIERPSRREIYVLPWSTFPPSFKQDVDRYLNRRAGVDLSNEGAMRPARPATLQQRQYQLRLAASALVHRGHDAQTIGSIAELLTFERYQEILRFFLDRHDGQTSPQVGALAAALKDLAKHWVKLDEPTLERFKKITSKLAVHRVGMTAKNRERLRPFDDAGTVAAFLGLPKRIRRDVEGGKRNSHRCAILAQMAAAIALLQAAPIRLKNLTELRLTDNLIAHGKSLYLVIGEDETKNGEPIDFELPAEAVEILSWYVREYRPHLLRQPSDALFPGARGKAKSSQTLALQLSQTVFRFTGLQFNTHLFRHAGGKIFLDARPGQYEVLRRVLGHRSIATTTSTYTGAETRSAGLHFASVIAERRRSLENRRSSKKVAPAAALQPVKRDGGKS
jgi:integrase